VNAAIVNCIQYETIIKRKSMTSDQIALIPVKLLWNLEEICIYTGFSKSTIYKHTMNGTIPYYKRGRMLFFKREEIEKWLMECRGMVLDEVKAVADTYVTLNKR
jgi:excisionase family DNA binding protein